jgi:acetoin utilization deacetylase AcuC-like enzyme
MEKYDVLPEQLIFEGTASESAFFQPDALSDQDLLLTHTFDYMNRLNKQALTSKEIRNIGFPMSPELVQRGKHIANGTYMCAKFAFSYGIAMNTAGGTHHSFADRGEGFCIFNDIAIAANLLLQQGLASSILIVDLDVHQGNGTARIFESESRVFTFSMHGERNYPLRKETSSLDIGLPDHCDDSSYLRILESNLNAVLDAVQPDFIFYLAGVDVLATDRLGRLSLSRQGCKARDRFVLNLAKSHGIPLAISMGGGYSHRFVDIIEAHANTFRLAQDIFF